MIDVIRHSFYLVLLLQSKVAYSGPSPLVSFPKCSQLSIPKLMWSSLQNLCYYHTDLGLEVLRSGNVKSARLCKSGVEKIRTEFCFSPGGVCHDKTMRRPDELLNLDESVTRRQTTLGEGEDKGYHQGASGLEEMEEV